MKKIIYSLAAALGLHSLNMNAEDKRPNIIFIMADDLGWSDLGVTGSDYYELLRACVLQMLMQLLPIRLQAVRAL